ncbi:uncharacterized protein B0I36DRAFT_361979 [Microdochium trichocladiopsis]|uniref:BZIP domain-containing protein n=1 Tax=Microdochium trichocladiopsis TaxID=1682393 RepID=A0A9P9BRU2_9PEZI|nr:uncharacterized protein B0I36DRAFT_361979 [Microdochium trichocladiopsis]KAH7033296.1 hypothetical protein B0I36DRAFT_361979 [Microdochium trichocladiopsis]
MASRSSGKHSSASSSSSSSRRTKESKSDDWSDVMDPEQRRRIQNRIAQRKFRERTRDQKEQSERDTRNKKYAHVSYLTPDPNDLGSVEDESLEGVPWGGPSMRHILSRGYAHERRRNGAGAAGGGFDDDDGSSYSHHHDSGNNSSGGSVAQCYQVDDHDDREYHDYDDEETVVPGPMTSGPVMPAASVYYADPYVAQGGYPTTTYGHPATAIPSYVVTSSDEYSQQADYSQNYDYAFPANDYSRGH